MERLLLDSSVARREEARSSSAAAVSTAASASRRRRATSVALERNPLQRLPDERGARPYSAYALLERADALDLPRELLVAALELGDMGENRVGRCGCHVGILSAGPTMPTAVRRLAA